MPTDHVNVLILGAGLSGIGAACHLQRNCPDKTFAILEARDSIGGTWDLFRYPGIRSDSDMFTLGYSFRPWEDPDAIAAGPSILQYIDATAAEYDVERHIRFAHRATRASWSSDEARWTVEAEHVQTGETRTFSCDFLYSCTGYYRYDEGYAPEFPGSERFGGQIIHPQHWPEDLDYDGKRVVVIGSGATAVTLVPSLAERAEHVTMLQRSPTYIVSLPARDAIADALRRWLPSSTAYAIVRGKNVLRMMVSFQLSRSRPELVRRLVRKGVERQLPAGYDVETNFEPRYDPWDQRMCLSPDGDLFKAIRRGRADVVTDSVETFTEAGIRLTSGKELPADIIVTATGLNLIGLGGLRLEIDGEQVELSQRIGYKGMMLCGVPNMAMALGYTNASWTLKADLVGEYICRLLAHMDRHGYAVCTPQPPDPSLPTEPAINLKSGYVQRALDQMPMQGTVAPWRLHQNYFRDLRLLKRGRIDDEMTFSSAPVSPRQDSTPIEVAGVTA